MPRINDHAAVSSNDDSTVCVMMAHESVFAESGDGTNQPTFCELRHPKTDQTSLYLFTEGDSKVSEVLQCKEEFRSWFIGETVNQDGSTTITTPVDVIFLLLPYLIKAHTEKDKKFMLLDQLVHDDDFPECNRLCRCDGVSELSCVADVRGIFVEADDDSVYRYNKEKTMSWLQLKVEQVASHLEESGVNVGTASHDASFKKSKSSLLTDHDDYIRYAHGLVSEYLPTCLSTELKTTMAIKDPVHEKPTLEEPATKRPKLDGGSPTKPSEDYSKGVSQPLGAKLGVKMTAAQKRLTKVDKAGMKNIASFFSQNTTKKKT